ncbi:hypothetical protein F5141DRAFT_1295617 [Pisolithus sp. B1]|nr:hypothetical protein F5141DRAFT_1295617 [Pisolithus sp. B1]
MAYFTSLKTMPKVIYPGINVQVYENSVDMMDPDQDRRSSLNPFEMKKNAAFAVEAFSRLRGRPTVPNDIRLVLAGGYNPQLEDNIRTLNNLIDLAAYVPSFPDVTPHTEPDILFLLNFTTAQRLALLQASSMVLLLYTPPNQHFGIGPVGGMLCGLPVLVCDSGGPTESILVSPSSERMRWLRAPDPSVWADTLGMYVSSWRRGEQP